MHVLRNYSAYISCYPKRVTLMALMTVIGAAQKLWIPYILRDLTNLFLDKAVSTSAIVSTLLLLFLASQIGVWCRMFRDMVNIEFQLDIIKKMFQDVFVNLHGHSMDFFQNEFVGSLVKKVNRYVFAFESIADKVLFFFAPFFLELVISLWIMFSIHLYFGTMMAVYMVLFMGITMFGLIKKKPLDLDATLWNTKVSGVLADTLTNVINIKSFASIDRESAYFADVVDTFKKSSAKLWWFDTYIKMVQENLMSFFGTAMYVVYGYACYHHLISPADMILLFGVDNVLKARMWDFGWQVRHLFSEAAQAVEMVEIFDKPYDIQDTTDTQLTVTKGHIHLDNVDFSFGENALFNNFSLSVNAGEKVALVGESGAGKSTLLKLLMRFTDVSNGAVKVDGQKITEVTQKSLCSNIAYVSQEPVMFHRSLFENIAYGKPDATQAEVEEAARLAHAHDFIMEKELGYLTFVGERGIKLSGGERQRIAIARAILVDAPIIVLDEATSALDSESEFHIQEALKNLMAKKTVIVVAHRLSTIRHMDRIIVLEKGHIIEDGSHRELLENAEGRYTRFWGIQSGSFLPV